MAPVIIPVAIAAASGAAGVAFGVTTAAAVALSVATTAVVAGASYLLAPRPSQASATASGGFGGGALGAPISAPSAPPLNVARAQVVQQPLPPRRFVYGRCRVGGPLLFLDVLNPYYFNMIALSDGEIESVEGLYLGEDLVPVDGSGVAVAGTRFANKVKVEYGTGTPTQAVSAMLAEDFPLIATADFRQQGIARAVVRLEHGVDAENQSFIYGEGTTPVFDIKGVKVPDPRLGPLVDGSSANHVYSTNPALCVLHALVYAWQADFTFENFDLDTVAEAANDCDATVSLGEESFKLFECAGVFQADAPLATQVSDMLGSFNGVVTFYNGKYEIHADKDRASAVTFTDLDLLGIEQYQYDAAAENVYSAIKGVYFDAEGSGRRNTTDVFEIEGESPVRETSIELPFTPTRISAEVLAYRALQESRGGGMAVFRVSDAALYLRPTEVFTLQSAAFPYINGEYKVVQVDLAGVGCIVVAKRKVPEVYADPATYVTT